MGELIVAMAVTAGVGVLSLPISYLRFWWTWSWVRSIMALIIHVALIGIVGGAVAWALAQHVIDHSMVPDSWLLEGLIYGVAGSVIVLADPKIIGSRRSSRSIADRAESGVLELPPALREAASIAGSSARFWASHLNRHSALLAERWMGALSTSELVQEAYWIQAELRASDIGVANQRALMALIVPAMEEVVHGDHHQGRASMIAFGSRIIVVLQLLKPKRRGQV